jgi:hypothetical protein
MTRLQLLIVDPAHGLNTTLALNLPDTAEPATERLHRIRELIRATVKTETAGET